MELSVNDLVVLTHETTDVADVDSVVINRLGIEYSLLSDGELSPLSDKQSALIADEWVDVAGEFPAHMGCAVFYDGEKYLSLQSSICQSQAEEMSCALKDENLQNRQRAVAIAKAYNGHVVWSCDPRPDRLGCGEYLTAVLVKVTDIAKRHSSFMSWRTELINLPIHI